MLNDKLVYEDNFSKVSIAFRTRYIIIGWTRINAKYEMYWESCKTANVAVKDIDGLDADDIDCTMYSILTQ